MFLFKKKEKKEKLPKSRRNREETAKKSTDFAVYNTVSGSQRSSYGDRSEMCAGAMNNNQRFATLQMLRNMKDTD